MPVSEAHLDKPRDLVRLRYPSYTGDLRGVVFVDGVAQNGCPAHIADRLRGIFGAVIEVVGPWDAPPVAAPEARPPVSGAAAPSVHDPLAPVSPSAPPKAVPPAEGAHPPHAEASAAYRGVADAARAARPRGR